MGTEQCQGKKSISLLKTCFAGFQNGNNLSGWDTDPHLLSPTSNGNKNDAETKDNYNKIYQKSHL